MFKPGQLVKVLTNNELSYEIGLIIKQEEKGFLFSDCYLVLVDEEVYPYREYEIQLLNEDNDV